MTATPEKLPKDLQARLDVILAKPVLRRCPALQQAIEILVRNSYERQPPSVLSGTQRALLLQLQEDAQQVIPLNLTGIPAGNSDTGDPGCENRDGVL